MYLFCVFFTIHSVGKIIQQDTIVREIATLVFNILIATLRFSPNTIYDEARLETPRGKCIYLPFLCHSLADID